MLTQADDEGRLIADAEQLRLLVFGYHPGIRERHVDEALREIQASGLIRLYQAQGTRYADFPSWKDHQAVSHPVMSVLPAFPGTPENSGDLQKPPEPSVLIGTDRNGSERKGTELFSSPRWGTPEALVALFNAETPDETPAVTTLSAARRKKAQEYLRQFPEEAWWRELCAQIHRSRFLRGLTKKAPGHETFTADFDWLLSRGKDQTENAVKVHDGRYQD